MSSVCMLKLKVQFCMQRKRFEECARNLTFHVGGAKASLRLRFCRKFWLQNVGGSEWAWSQNRLSAWRCKDWHGLHESSYCYFKVCAGTHNLNTFHFTLVIPPLPHQVRYLYDWWWDGHDSLSCQVAGLDCWRPNPFLSFSCNLPFLSDLKGSLGEYTRWPPPIPSLVLA